MSKDFWKIYSPNREVVSEEFECDWEDETTDYSGMFETFGNDLKTVLRFAANQPKKVWTMVDTDNGQAIISGYRLVNRIAYIITAEDRKEDYEEYFY